MNGDRWQGNVTNTEGLIITTKDFSSKFPDFLVSNNMLKVSTICIIVYKLSA